MTTTTILVIAGCLSLIELGAIVAGAILNRQFNRDEYKNTEAKLREANKGKDG